MSKKLLKKNFLEAYEKTFGNISAACKMTGIVRNTYYNWLQADKKFAKDIDDCAPREKLKDLIESKLISRINAEDTTAIIFAAKTIAKDRGYIEKTETDVKITSPVRIDWGDNSNDGEGN